MAPYKDVVVNKWKELRGHFQRKERKVTEMAHKKIQVAHQYYAEREANIKRQETLIQQQLMDGIMRIIDHHTTAMSTVGEGFPTLLTSHVKEKFLNQQLLNKYAARHEIVLMKAHILQQSSTIAGSQQDLYTKVSFEMDVVYQDIAGYLENLRQERMLQTMETIWSDIYQKELFKLLKPFLKAKICAFPESVEAMDYTLHARMLMDYSKFKEDQDESYKSLMEEIRTELFEFENNLSVDRFGRESQTRKQTNAEKDAEDIDKRLQKAGELWMEKFAKIPVAKDSVEKATAAQYFNILKEVDEVIKSMRPDYDFKKRDQKMARWWAEMLDKTWGKSREWHDNAQIFTAIGKFMQHMVVSVDPGSRPKRIQLYYMIYMLILDFRAVNDLADEGKGRSDLHDRLTKLLGKFEVKEQKQLSGLQMLLTPDPVQPNDAKGFYYLVANEPVNQWLRYEAAIRKYNDDDSTYSTLIAFWKRLHFGVNGKNKGQLPQYFQVLKRNSALRKLYVDAQTIKLDETSMKDNFQRLLVANKENKFPGIHAIRARHFFLWLEKKMQGTQAKSPFAKFVDQSYLLEPVFLVTSPSELYKRIHKHFVKDGALQQFYHHGNPERNVNFKYAISLKPKEVFLALTNGNIAPADSPSDSQVRKFEDDFVSTFMEMNGFRDLGDDAKEIQEYLRWILITTVEDHATVLKDSQVDDEGDSAFPPGIVIHQAQFSCNPGYEGFQVAFARIFRVLKEGSAKKKQRKYFQAWSGRDHLGIFDEKALEWLMSSKAPGLLDDMAK